MANARASNAPSGTPWCRNHDVSPRTRNPARRDQRLCSPLLLTLTFLACFLTTTASAFQLPFFNNPSLGSNTTATMTAQKYTLPPLPYAYDVSSRPTTPSPERKN